MENLSESHESNKVNTLLPAVFSVGQHIKSKDGGIHGIIFKVSTNYLGWVYCIRRKDWTGLTCINENDCELF